MAQYVPALSPFVRFSTGFIFPESRVFRKEPEYGGEAGYAGDHQHDRHPLDSPPQSAENGRRCAGATEPHRPAGGNLTGMHRCLAETVPVKEVFSLSHGAVYIVARAQCRDIGNWMR